MRKNLHLYYYLFIFPFVLFDHYLYICGRVGGYDFASCMLCCGKLYSHVNQLIVSSSTRPTDGHKHK